MAPEDECAPQTEPEAQQEVITVSIGSLTSKDESEALEVPCNGTVDDLINQLSCPEGCSGFLATAKITDRDPYDDDFEDQPIPSDLAVKLAANGGILLEPGNVLSCYGIDTATCSEVTLFAVYAVDAKQPTVFKRDMEDRGFGERIYSYVKLNKEDKELVAARDYFRAPLFPWLQPDRQDKEGLLQTITFRMDDNFPDDELRTLLTVHIVPEGDHFEISCTNLAGDLICSIKVAGDDLIDRLQSCLCEKLQWASVTLWNESEMVAESNHVSRYSLLTAEQSFTTEHVSGCYQCHQHTVRPAGYSASATSMSDILVLEPGKAALKRFLKGDYKRAEELQQLVMTDARWFIQELGSETHVVRITGKAKLSRFWVHERSGPDGLALNKYECFASVTIPLHQLERAQAEEYHYNCTEGSGWTCGSENYKSSFFLPACMLNALRTKSEGEEDAFPLRRLLNKDESRDYPYNLIVSQRRHIYANQGVPRVSEDTMGLIKYIREHVAGTAQVSIEELIQLQASRPVHARSEDADQDETI